METGGGLAPLADVVERLAGSPAVAAVALVGSQVSGAAEPGSDLDVFVYTDGVYTDGVYTDGVYTDGVYTDGVYTDGDLREQRARLAAELADPAAWRSVHETAFGDGDVWRRKHGGVWIDLMYWPTAWAETQLRRVLVEHVAMMGYSTAFWRSIHDARPLYERDGWHGDLQRRARQPYPEALRRNIVGLNRPYLRDHPFSYREQAAKAIARHDLVSVNHRIVAWLASYFDILFTVNRILHPGEKRLLEHVARECQAVPAGLTTAVERLVGLAGRAEPDLLAVLDELTEGLDALLRREDLLPV